MLKQSQSNQGDLTMNETILTESINNASVIKKIDNQMYFDSDIDNAKRLLNKFGKDLHYEPKANNEWYEFSGKRWEPKAQVEIIGKACQIAEEIKHEYIEKKTELAKIENSGLTPDKALVKRVSDMEKHAKRSGSKNALDSMLYVAASRSDIVIDINDFDKDQFLLNTLNGTLNLKTGELYPHNRDDLMTKMVPYPYVKDAKAPTFLKFMDDIMCGDKEAVKYIQRAIGYSLTGSTKEHCFFLCTGNGSNGKSTLLGIIKKLLNDYGDTTAFSTFIVAKSDKISNDIAKMKGKRFIIALEGDQSALLDEAKIKTLTGGDELTARFLYKNDFTFRASHKIFLGTNNMPVIRGTDNGIWRRVRVIPFNAKFEGYQNDRDLESKLVNEMEGIFAWAVEGCLDWQAESLRNEAKGLDRTGLTIPQLIADATKEYRDSQDLTKMFFDDVCELQSGHSIGADKIYQVYLAWASDNGFRQPLAKPAFKKKFLALGVNLGFTQKRTNKGEVWKGVQIKYKPQNQSSFGGQSPDLKDDLDF